MKTGMKMAALLVAASAMLLGGCGFVKRHITGSRPTVAIVQMMSHKSLEEAKRGIIQGLSEEGYTGDKISLIQENAGGEASNLPAIMVRLRSQHPDIVCAISTPAAQEMAQGMKHVPIVATAVSDFRRARLVQSDDHPGTNVTGVSDECDVRSQLELGRLLMPHATRIGLIYSSSEPNSASQADQIKAYAAANQMDVVEHTVSDINDLPQIASSFSGKVDFIYVPSDNMMASAMPALIKATDAMGIPVIGGAAEMVKNGALAGFSVDYYEMGRKASHMTADILNGRAHPMTMPVQKEEKVEVVLNRQGMERFSLSVPPELENRFLYDDEV